MNLSINVSTLLIAIGACTMAYGLISQAFAKKATAPKPAPLSEPEPTPAPIEPEPAPAEKPAEPIPAPEKLASAKQSEAGPKEETLYKSMQAPEPAPEPVAVVAPAAPVIDEAASRAALQSKIKEVMDNMKTRQETEPLEPVPAPVMAEPAPILSHANLAPKAEPVEAEPVPAPQLAATPKWGFAEITAETNASMENILLASGAKLLSEIRVGSSGVDYLVLAKDEIAVVQMFNRDGSWLAGEEESAGENMWFSEASSAPSPVIRAAEAAKSVTEIIGRETALPITACVCVEGAEILNAAKASDEWAHENVKVCSLAPSALPSLSDIFAPGAKEPMDDATMERIVAALETAEQPE
ncbi:MAG: hypothetical protein LBL52_04600 [Rickettsiales bacterium]|jgi:hypothetical protein|nr:hypothetical protein [Rickettsiales bacterium]